MESRLTDHVPISMLRSRENALCAVSPSANITPKSFNTDDGNETVFLWTSILIGLAMSARAEPDAVAQWLMNEPVTLWDRGMERAQRVAKDAGRVVVDDLGVAWIYTRYHWDNNEIDINLDVDEFPSPLTHELCNQTRRSFMAEIAGSALKPAVIPAGSDLAAAAAAGVDPGLLERKKGELGRAYCMT